MAIRFLKVTSRIFGDLVDWLGNPLISGAVFCLFFFNALGDEWILYMYTVIYFIYLLVEKRFHSRKKRVALYIIFAILFAPAIIKIPLALLVGTFYIIIKIEKLKKRNLKISKFLWELENDFTGSLIQLYMQLLFMLLYLSLLVVTLEPTLVKYYAKYLNYREQLDFSYNLYFLIILTIFTMWTITSLCLSLIRSATLLHHWKGKFVFIVINFVGTLVVFFTVPDIMFSFLYSFGFFLINQDVKTVEMFKFAFSLHHQIAFSDLLLGYQNTVSNNGVLAIIEFTHVISNKIIEVTILSTIIISTFSEKVRDYVRGRFSGEYRNDV